MNKTIQEWIKCHNLNVEWIKDNLIQIEGYGKFIIIRDKEKIFNEEFILIMDDDEIDLWDEFDYFLFPFGSNWYYSAKEVDKIELNIFKYLGKYSEPIFDSEISYLGIHGKYELGSGSRDYKDWCKKAKFLGYTTLGICENKTLAGVYSFQQACKENQIKSIIGYQCQIKKSLTQSYKVKLYVKNLEGWNNLLKLHQVCVLNDQVILEKEFLKYISGLIIVLCSDVKINDSYQNLFDLGCYFQFDPVEWKSQTKELDHLENLKFYLDKYLDKIPPILICDSYYLDQDDYKIKPILSKIVNPGFQNESKDQYFKHPDQIIQQLNELFKEDDNRFGNLFYQCVDNLEKVKNDCQFEIKKIGTHLPQYEMNEEELKQFSSNEELFFDLIDKGFQKFISNQVEDEDLYIKRLETEIAVLKEGNVIDYFLILWDIIRFSQSIGSYPSIGRGSAAGSLVGYLLGITRLDPIKYDLLFERFLNKARLLGGSLPDIDYDVPSDMRQQIIDYIINKYGKDQVAFIGTSQNFKLKSTVKDLIKLRGAVHSYANFITSLIGKDYDYAKMSGLFDIAIKEPAIKEMINKYPEMIEMIDLCIFQPRSFGIHAAGVVIVPKYNQNKERTYIWNYVPIRLVDGAWVTEWEKETVENIGLLKMDLLGLAQLDKFIRINQLIQETGEKPPTLEDVNLEDQDVFKLFKEGLTEDVFQFNTAGLKQYCIDLQPDHVNDLIAANALYRPGTMESNTHREYVKVKHGYKTIDLPPMLEDILQSTFGLYIYQEQAMLSYGKITNCDPNETDDFRKVITKTKPGKKNPDIEKYENSFKQNYFNLIQNQQWVDRVWDAIIAFSTYGFNIAHAACYAITGYVSQWYKCHYPLEFYTTSLERSKEETMKSIINEIQTRKLVTLSPPDINKSANNYFIDRENNSIYWSISSIKFVGDKIIESLLEERNQNGQFYSFEEFLQRVKGKGVNKRVIENLILCGCFDEIENISKPNQRLKLWQQYAPLTFPEGFDEKNYQRDWLWIIRQNELCGFGEIDYFSIFKNTKLSHRYIWCDYEKLSELKDDRKTIVTGGFIKELKTLKTKRGEAVKVIIDQNNKIFPIILWNDHWMKNKELLQNSLNKILLISGSCKTDSNRETFTVMSNDSTQLEIA